MPDVPARAVHRRVSDLARVLFERRLSRGGLDVEAVQRATGVAALTLGAVLAGEEVPEADARAIESWAAGR